VSALTKNLKPYWEQLTLPLVSFFSKLNLSPASLTLGGLIFAVLSVFPLSAGNFTLGAALVGLSALCDALDGHLARRSGKTTPFGALLDSTVDRLADFFPLMGLALYYSADKFWLSVVLLNAALWFSVSYAKARMEGLGIKERIGGLFERPERLAVLLISLPFGSAAVKVGLSVTLLGSFITLLQRLYLGYKLLR